MSLNTYMERLKYVDNLIRKRATGDTATLAKKLKLSRSQTLRFIKEMKEAGFPITYSKPLSTYYYAVEGKFDSNLFKQDLSENEMRAVIGGKTFFNFFLESHYMRLWDVNFVE